jgi:hypothetical protein
MNRALIAMVVSLAMSHPILAQECIPEGAGGFEHIPGDVITTYRAEWSDMDHVGLDGDRLTQAAEILGQDRLNVQHIGRFTRFDRQDSFFMKRVRLRFLREAAVFSYCPTSSNAVKREIVNETTSGSVVFFLHDNGRYAAIVDLIG